MLSLIGHRALVAGAGTSGLAMARALKVIGAKVLVVNDSAIPESSLKVLESLNIEFMLTADFSMHNDTFDAVYASQGWKLEHSLFVAAESQGIPVVGEVDLAWRINTSKTNPSLWFGITGTNGKTTIAHLIQYLWNSLGLASGTIGTLGVAFAGKNERFEYPGVRTTPEAPELQAVFKKMLDSHVQKVVMEVSSHALSLGRVSGIKFDYALFTNLSQDHLDFHSDMEDYFRAKSMLFDSSISKTGIVCIDDKWGQRLVSESKIPVLTVGKSDADFTYSLSNGTFELSWKESTVSLVSPLLGDFNATNTAMAMAVLLIQMENRQSKLLQ